MTIVNTALLARLRTFNHRRLSKAELLILSKVISDSISVPPVNEPNMAVYVLTHASKIESVVNILIDYIHIPREDRDVIKQRIAEFLMWRSAVAHTPGLFMFSGRSDTIIDEMGLMTKYVDMSYLCELNSILGTVNQLKEMFQMVVTETVLSGNSSAEPVRSL